MNKTTAILFTGLILGLGWAIRGHFGHEWGAAWAGTMGGLAIIVAIGRKDWWNHAPVLTFLAGIGWAVGGMMSYGIVIGYCRGVDFWNVTYGYAMLAIIGGLYGCMGGGLLGLGLASNPEKRPQWGSLMAEMVAGGWLAWGLLIYQMEWFMTPPRSELWAACLGAAAAMLWYMYRNGFHNAFRVAVYAALGAGFGFSFGNFLQTLGNASGISYNWWNVMEFTLGFCGGTGMAYAIITGNWPDKKAASTTGNIAALLAVFLFIPVTNFVAAFSSEKLSRLAERLEVVQVESFISSHQNLGIITMILFSSLSIYLWFILRKKTAFTIPILLFTLSLYYILFGHIIKGWFFAPFDFGNSISTYLPILFIAFGIWWFHRDKSAEIAPVDHEKTGKKEVMLLGGLLVVILLIAFVSIHSHDGIGGYHERF